MRTKDVIAELSDLPLRRNTLKAQRLELGLSRAALARILEVDPSTVYRQELQNPMSLLWCYALRGIRAEAEDKTLKAMRRKRKAEAAREDQLLGPSRFDAEGLRFTAEAMRAESRRSPPPVDQKPHTTRRPRVLPKGWSRWRRER